MTRVLALAVGAWLVAVLAGTPMSAQVPVTAPTNKHNLSTSGP